VFSGHTHEGWFGWISPGQEIVDPAVGMAVDDFGDDIREIGMRVDVTKFAGLDERGDDGPMFSTAIGPGEQCIFPVQRDRADGTFDDVGVDLDAAIIDEEG
jgi:hypothetical protein